jgi:eukaryotic-like serine/threonine-protein kinase
LAVHTGCKKKRPAPLSSTKAITFFSIRSFNNQSLLNDINAEIINDTIFLDVSASSNLSSLTPTIAFSGKTIDPLPQLPQNFNNTCIYTVTAEDGSTKKYKTKNRILSSQKQINTYVFSKTINPTLTADLVGIITGDTITVSLPPGLPIGTLIPSITFAGAAINPQAGQPADFNAPVQYTVTAADGTTRTYIVFAGANTDVLVQGSDRYLYNINAINGSLKWRYYTGAESVPTCHNGVAFANGADGVVYAINMIDGSLKWKSSPPKGQYTLTIPSVKYGKVYCAGSGDLNYPNSIYLYYAGFVLALNEETGTQEWFSKLNTSYTYQSSANTNVTIDNNLVLFYDIYLGLFVFNASNGTPAWDKSGDMLGRGNPVIYNGNIYYSVEGGIRSLTETGQNRWLFLNRTVFTSPSVYNGIIYTANADSLYAFNTNGSLLSSFQLGVNRAFYAPVLYNNMAILSNSYNELRAYSLASGSIIWERKNFKLQPVAANGQVFIADASGSIHCLNAATGTSKWSFTSNTSFNRAACIVDSKNTTYHTPDSGEAN